MAKLAGGGGIPVNSSLVGPVFLSGVAGGVDPVADDEPMSVIPVVSFPQCLRVSGQNQGAECF